MTDHILTTGDIVKLKAPYKLSEFPQASDPTWRGFTHGIVVDVLSTQIVVNGEAYGSEYPRRVSLNLYDESGQLMIVK